MKIQVSAVVFNYNGGQRIINTLRALHRQSYPLQRIVVVDDGSSDGSDRRICREYPDVLLLRQTANQGLSAARNTGLAAVDTRLLLMVDYDVYLEPTCLEKMVDACLEERAAIVCPRVRLLPERDIVQADGAGVHFIGSMMLRHGYCQHSTLPAVRVRVDGCIGACMLLERQAVLQSGAFCELLFLYQEDFEFTLRMRLAGHRLVCEPAAEVFHDRGDATPELSFRGTGLYPMRRAYENLHNRLVIILIHYRARTLLILLPVLLLYEAISLAYSLYRGWWPAWRQAVAMLWLNQERIRELRSAAQRQRRIDDRQVLAAGPLPLAPGLLRSALASTTIRCLSALLNGYWLMVRRWVG